MPRDTSAGLEAILGNAEAHSFVRIELASGSVLRFSTAEKVIEGFAYLGLMQNVSPLRMSNTKRADRVTFEICNLNSLIGQAIIEDEHAFDNSFAVFGTYFKDPLTGAEFYEEKLPGEITRSSVDGDTVKCMLIDELSAAEYYGAGVSSVFPDVTQAAPTVQTPAPPNDLFNDDYNNYPTIAERKMAYLRDDFNYGRNYLPEQLLY